MLEFTFDLTCPNAQGIIPDALRHHAGASIDVLADFANSVGT
jgi:hypothetical protein